MENYEEMEKRLTMPVDKEIRFEKVILSNENRAKVEAFIGELRNRNLLIENGLKPMSKILLYGDSGCGKTYLTKALSNYLGYKLLYVDIANSLSDNSIANNIADIFKLANYLQNCIIFLDECDSVAWNRDASVQETGIIRRATNSLFQYLDQMNNSNVFVAATNMLHRIDPAFERRFDLKLEFRNPSMGLLNNIKSFLFSQFILIDDIDIKTKELIEKRIKLSYYTIQVIVERAMKKAVIEGRRKIYISEIYEDIIRTCNLKFKMVSVEEQHEIIRKKI